MPEASSPELRERTKLALRRMAKAVTVITTRHEGVRFAMAATAADALSMDPPSMMISVNRSASIHAPLLAGASFGVQVLARGQQDIAAVCGGNRKGEERFAHGEWTEGHAGVPVLVGALASIICSNVQSLSFGSHSVFIGEVVEVRQQGDIEPLVYIDGRYTSTLPD